MTPLRKNLIGAGWMTLSMALFAVEDALLKLALQSIPIGQTLMMFGALGTVFFVSWAAIKGQPIVRREMLSRLMIVRFGFEITGRLFYFLAVALTTLSSATIILQATPIIVVAAASILFKERVGPRRWIAVAVGFIGVLIVLRPTADAFSPMSILAVIGLIGFAGRDLTSRMAPPALGLIGLGTTGFFALTIAGILYAVWAEELLVIPTLTSIGLILCITGTGLIAYLSLMTAMRTGDVSSVTPFRYTRLIFGVSLGVLVFSDTLDAITIIGSALIVASGIFILWRGKSA